MVDLNSVMAILSKEEKEVFFLALTNMSPLEIAEELKITRSGVRFHLSKIFRKTNMRSRVELLSNFVETTKGEQNVLLLMFQMKKELDDLKARLESLSTNSQLALPTGRFGEPIKKF